jgi:hypothetical protein
VAETLARGSRITGTERAELTTRLGARYAAGESIRAIAEDTGRSFGFVHGLVKESGVQLRSRGGATRGPAARAVATSSSSEAADATGQGSAPKTAKSEVATGDAKGKGKGKGKKSGKKSKR